jgi:hypothetical protein
VHQRNPEIGLVPGSCVLKQAHPKSHIPHAQLGGVPDLHFYPYLLPVSAPLFSKLSHWDRMANSWVILGFRKKVRMGLCIHGAVFRQNSLDLGHFNPRALAPKLVCIGGTQDTSVVPSTSVPNLALRKFHLTQARVGRSPDLQLPILICRHPGRSLPDVSLRSCGKLVGRVRNSRSGGRESVFGQNEPLELSYALSAELASQFPRGDSPGFHRSSRRKLCMTNSGIDAGGA